jgi:preprotein translocase subunit YajC
MIIRPQMKAAKEQRAMIAALQKGDEVITSGGIVGKISKVSEAFVSVEIAPNTEITVQKQAVQSALPKGTIKSL